jgi:8-oxo-dGTP diphosphatase
MAITVEQRPYWPRLGASAAIFRNGTVLLWSLPGGHVEPGERVADAARREVFEETGVIAEILGLVDLHEVIRRENPGGEVSWHYVIAVHYGLWRTGEPMPASDCRATRFVALDALHEVPLTEGAELIIRRAHQLLGEAQ